MKVKLMGLIILTEVILVGILLFWLNQVAVTDKIGTIVVWLLPICLGMHMTEEFFFPGGFINWNKAYRPGIASIDDFYYFKINALGIILTSLAALGANSFFGLRSWFVSLVAFAGYNALWHINGTFQTRRYSPGVVTGTILYLPLTIFSFTYFLSTGALDIVWAAICIILGPIVYRVVTDFVRGSGSKKTA